MPFYNPQHHQRSNNFQWLLLSLGLVIIAPIIITILPIEQNLLLEILLFFVIITGAYFTTETRAQLRLGILLGLLVSILLWPSVFNPQNLSLQLALQVAFLAFYSFVMYFLFRSLANSPEVNLNLIYGALSGYVLIGFAGAHFCRILELLHPNSFHNLTAYDGFSYYYFSLVTITTLGYGDISPATPQAQSIAMVLAVTGQVYLTVIVAILVGKYLTKNV